MQIPKTNVNVSGPAMLTWPPMLHIYCKRSTFSPSWRLSSCWRGSGRLWAAPAGRWRRRPVVEAGPAGAAAGWRSGWRCCPGCTRSAGNQARAAGWTEARSGCSDPWCPEPENWWPRWLLHRNIWWFVLGEMFESSFLVITERNSLSKNDNLLTL